MKAFISFLGSLKVTVYIFCVLVMILSIGSFIIPGQNHAFYAANYGKFLGRVIIAAGLNDLYAGYICRGLFFLLGLNLLICTVKTVFSKNLFKNRNRSILFFVHAGVLFIFIGALTTKFQKTSEIKEVLPQEKFILGKSSTQIRLNKFIIKYHPGINLPKSYVSDVTVLENGEPSFNQDIRVNHPLHYRGYSIYQYSFNVFPELELLIRDRQKIIYEGFWRGDQPLVIPDKNNLKFKVEHFLPDIKISPQGEIFLVSNRVKNYALLLDIYQSGQEIKKQWIFEDPDISGSVRTQDKEFEFEVKKIDCFYSAVLEIVKDPGFGIVSFGFLIMIVAMVAYLIDKKN